MAEHYNKSISVSVVVQAAAYATGELLCAKLVVPVLCSSGLIRSIKMGDLASTAVDFEVVIFEQDPTLTTFSINNPFDVDDGDLPKVAGSILLATADRFNYVDNGIKFKVLPAPLPFTASKKNGGELYIALLSRGAPTFASTADVDLKIGITTN